MVSENPNQSLRKGGEIASVQVRRDSVQAGGKPQERDRKVAKRKEGQERNRKVARRG